MESGLKKMHFSKNENQTDIRSSLSKKKMVAKHKTKKSKSFSTKKKTTKINGTLKEKNIINTKI